MDVNVLFLSLHFYVNLRRIVVVGGAELARGLLGRHALLDALPLLGVQLLLIYPLHLKLWLQFLELLRHESQVSFPTLDVTTLKPLHQRQKQN